MHRFEHEQRVSIPLTKHAPSSARHWFTDEGSRDNGAHLPLDVRDRVLLLLSELVTNSVSHSGLSAPSEVEVAVRAIPGGLHVEVVDDGVGIVDDPTTQGPEHFGLRFVDTVTDRWGYTNDPTRVWFEILGDGV